MEPDQADRLLDDLNRLRLSEEENGKMRAVLLSIREDFDLVIGAHDVSDTRHRSHGGQHTNGRCCPFGTVNPSAVTEFKRIVQTIDGILAEGK